MRSGFLLKSIVVFLLLLHAENQHEAVVTRGLKHCTEICFAFTEIPLAAKRGSSNLGESEGGPFSPELFNPQ